MFTECVCTLCVCVCVCVWYICIGDFSSPTHALDICGGGGIFGGQLRLRVHNYINIVVELPIPDNPGTALSALIKLISEVVLYTSLYKL